jgi:hypothetical protein
MTRWKTGGRVNENWGLERNPADNLGDWKKDLDPSTGTQQDGFQSAEQRRRNAEEAEKITREFERFAVRFPGVRLDRSEVGKPPGRS